jgi:hypothetical protein
MPEVLEQYQQVSSQPGSSHCLTHFNATAALGMNGDTITISNANRPAVIVLAPNINESYDNNYIM